MTQTLAHTEIAQLVAQLNQHKEEGAHWHQDGDRLVKTFTFNNFIAAFGWMSQVAMWAEKLNHHPEWKNVYNRVEVVLTTHDAKGLTERDFLLAQKMDKLASN
ncbi:4a-hydroxytetrahydrobiopterin dehydratase [Alteromonas sp. C1M14]|uniref:4a-hydroxytetrahydrobiopterin dehydratase n=1 Tax=Alteromonas sp. C1M14 TaxID=2841567 RepID=UPI001C08F585|nr:4a-hydroxytetrahydrobiopterin dehydratase [Alteromonas sp. C1M14]MBU2977130.1 4a-hydroxytetrahydrobiopterin dehydratase [Alteromonas sp. C1M14]